MCPYCKDALSKSHAETLFFQGNCNNTTYSNLWPIHGGNSWFDTEENHTEFLASLTWPSALATSKHFGHFMIWPDCLHVMYRGILSHFCASALKFISTNKFWTASSRSENLLIAYLWCDTWSRENGRGGLGIEEFPSDTLNLEASAFPEMNCKGADVKTICLWLET